MKEYTQLTAALSFSKSQFNKWLFIRWQMIKEYFEGKSQEIAPCMFGDFWYNQKHYKCDSSGISEF